MRTPERFQSHEYMSAPQPEKKSNQEKLLSLEFEKIISSRAETLRQIERWLKVKTRELLKDKIAKEKQSFLDLYQRDRKARAVAQATTHILNRTYFKQKSLDVSIFE